MGTSTWMIRLIGLAAAGLAVWYIAQLRGDIADLERRLAAVEPVIASRPADSPAPPPAPAAEPVSERSITPAQQRTMVLALSRGGMYAGSPVWFATVPNDPEAAAFQKTLQSVFEEAGWEIKGNSDVRFQMKPGIFVFAADVETPEYVDAITEAFESAGIDLAGSGRGYRDYFAERKAANPDWVGFEMIEGQTAVVAIGRRPPAGQPKTATP